MHENIVIGGSMGGLVCRYALKKMESTEYIEEQEALNPGGIIGHDTNLFISFDVPQQGANVPLSLQLVIEELYNDSILKEYVLDFRNQLYSSASKTLATNHIRGLINNNYNEYYPSYPEVKRNQFLADLEALRTEEDGNSVYPGECRIISVANRSGRGIRQHYVSPGNSKTGNRGCKWGWEYRF